MGLGLASAALRAHNWSLHHPHQEATMPSTPTFKLSMLDLVAVREGASVGQALDVARQTVQHAERLGFSRYWVAEHHNMTGIASSATAVLVAMCLVAEFAMHRSGGGRPRQNGSWAASLRWRCSVGGNAI